MKLFYSNFVGLNDSLNLTKPVCKMKFTLLLYIIKLFVLLFIDIEVSENMSRSNGGKDYPI